MLQDCAIGETEEAVIRSKPEAIQAWVNSLRKRYGDARLAVRLEQKRDPLIDALCQFENLILYPIREALIDKVPVNIGGY